MAKTSTATKSKPRKRTSGTRSRAKTTRSSTARKKTTRAVEGSVTEAEEQSAAPESDATFELTTSRQFGSWLAEQKVNLAFTTYQAGKLFFLGLGPEGRLSVFNRTLERCMGLAYADDMLHVSSLYQIYTFVDATRAQQIDVGYDSVFVPQLSRFTGDVDAHDLAIGADGDLLFANTLFSCVAAASLTHSFRPVWKPPFIDRLAAEDRCHLNGMALKDGKPKYVTAVGESNVADGWRDHRASGGIVMDCESDEIVATGFSMPHSPRWHDDALWVHDSGSGMFGKLDIDTGKFESVAFCPGYLRGLDFVGNFAIVGVSKQRENRTFSGLALDDNLEKNKVEPRCGLYVVDLRSGDLVHWVRIEGVVQELFDVVVLPDRTNTAAIGFRSDEIRRVISIE